MKRKYEVELEVTKRYTVKVNVEGEYSGEGDPDIEEDAKLVADNMSHDSWNYKDTEFDIQFIEKLNDAQYEDTEH